MGEFFGRRLSVVGIAALLALGAIAESGVAQAASAQPLNVLSAFSPNDVRGPAYAAAVKGFTAKTGIPVNNTFSGDVELFNVYEMSVLAKQEPDVLIVNLYDKALDWTNTGATLPVTDVVAKWGLDKIISPAALADWTDSKGRIVALPFAGFTWPIWYNMALLKKAGISDVPKTYDELIADAAKLRAAGITPMAIGGSDWTGEKFLLELIQLTVSDDEMKQLMAKGGYCNSPAAMKGIAQFLRLKAGGVFIDDAQGLTTDNMYASFYQGQAAIMTAGSWAFPNEPADMVPNVVLGGFPLPDGSTHSKPIAYQGFTSAGFWLTKNSEKRLDDFKAFVEYMYSPAVAATFVATAGDVPVVNIPDIKASLGNQPLLLQALTVTPKTVQYGVFPDFFVPGSRTQDLINATARAFAPDATAASICAALDGVYK